MKCDIIIPIWNQLEFTRQCIESVFKNTNYPLRIIAVDNSSDNPTKTYLEGLARDKQETVTLIRNQENLGFVKASNQGIRESCSEYICFLNNDTIVTKGWLSEMIKVAEKSPEIGIVNPGSNTLGRNPRKGQSIEALAAELKSHSGEYNELAWATGFCMLIKRKVLEKVGAFDEIYGMGNFEDADFCKRAQKLGYLSVCAKAAYVYHCERRSFIKFRRFDQEFERNRRIFYAKWGKPQRLLYILTKNDPSYTKRMSRESLQLARQGNVVWIFLKAKPQGEIARHSNIYVYSPPEPFFNLISFWRIIKRKKKFDKIYVDQEGYAKFLHKFKFFHKAEVTYAE